MTKARDLANIISGGFTADDIPNIDASKITSGSIADARLPATALNSNVDLTNLSASNLTSGTIPTARITALPSGVGGKVLQVVTATDSTPRNTTSSGSFVTASNTLSINITPSSTSSKIFVTMNSNGYSNNAGQNVFFTLYRDSTNLGHSVDGLINWWDETNRQIGNGFSMSYLDSPSSTSQLTYQVYMKINPGTTAFMNYNRTQGSITAFEIAG